MRPTRHAVNMEIARVMGYRKTCDRARGSCIIVVDGRIVSTGYAGSPSGLPHCTDVGCDIGLFGGCVRTVHAEAGAIAFAARKGLPIEGATLYTTLSPCLDCAKLIINAGIETVIYAEAYRDPAGINLLEAAGIEVKEMPLEDLNQSELP